MIWIWEFIERLYTFQLIGIYLLGVLFTAYLADKYGLFTWARTQRKKR